MTVNRRELARRIAHRAGYHIGDVEDVLKVYEQVVVEALLSEEEIKQGTLFKLTLQELAEKRAYNGFKKTYFNRPAKRVPKFKPLASLERIELPPKKEE